ncbi:MAG: hypothetical protein AAB838_03305, partial [Patescibacteria group bacterium]
MINKLLKLDHKLFHTNDLATIWESKDRHNLRMAISRYIQKGILVPVYRGLYSTVSLKDLNVYELGQAVVHNYAYVSTETVLFLHGVIFQTVYPTTFVSGISRRVTVAGHELAYRKLPDKYLHNKTGINSENGIFIADLERAVADIL